MDDSGDKLYYKISEVAEMLDVPVSTIRFWEKEFKELKPVRSSSGVRYYKQNDIETLRIVHYLLKVQGLKIEAAREQLKLNRNNSSRRLQVLDLLSDIKEDLILLQSALNERK